MRQTIAFLVRLAVRHPGQVLAFWLAAAFMGGALLWHLGPGAFTTEVERQDGSSSVRAAALLREHFPQHAQSAARPNEVVVLHSATQKVDDPIYAVQAQIIARELQAAVPGVVRGARSWFTDDDESLVSADRHAALVPLVVEDAPRHAAALRAALARASAGTDLNATLVGQASVGLDYRRLADEDLRAELLIGLPAAALVLLAVFGAPLAALLPLVVAAVAMAIALGAVVLAGQVVPVYFLVTNMVVMMCMAVGIDVALFMLARWREERARGRGDAAAALRSARSAGRAVVWSGATVALALLGLLLVPTNVFRGLALGAIVAVATAVLAALTLLPALLMLLGRHVDAAGWYRSVAPNRAGQSAPGLGRSAHDPRTLPLAVRRPWACAIVSTGLLVALAAPALTLKIGFAGLETLPSNLPARQAFERMQQSFRLGSLAEAQVVVYSAAGGAAAQAELLQSVERLRVLLASDTAFVAERIEVRPGPDARVHLLWLPMQGVPEDSKVLAGIERLRAQWIPQAFVGAAAKGLEVQVGGLAARYVDFFALIRSHTPWVMATVLASSFVLLALAFRSLVVPLKAIVLNLLSVGAAYGALVLVFQQGIGAHWLGFKSGVVIEAWIPLFLFTLLYGLSMDYHVFLLSRMREHYDASGDNTAAVVHALRSTARVIGGAALIMVAVFVGLAAGQLVMFQQMGFGLAVALLLDATLVRLLLVPASMTLLGERNWYAPAWLARRRPAVRHERP
ncbi:MAG: MMPL family transporter [Burkholderiales bacterium]